MKEKTGYCCASLWEQGRRQNNQDALALWHMSKKGKNRLWGIVCDGIGGLSEGENASSYVVRQSAAWFMTRGHRIRGRRKREKALQQLFFQLHEELKDYGSRKGIQLGTTVTFFWLDDRELLWGHCGDSRLYYLHRNRVKQLTRDDCQPDGALNKAIGAGDWRLLSLGRKRLGKRDRLLLCTDGFYRGLEPKELGECLNREFSGEEQVQRILRQMGERKLAMGETDNISALYCGRCRREE